MTEHNWLAIPSRKVWRKWCTRCGCLAEGVQRFADATPPYKWDWQYTIPSKPPQIFKDHEPDCSLGKVV